MAIPNITPSQLLENDGKKCIFTLTNPEGKQCKFQAWTPKSRHNGDAPPRLLSYGEWPAHRYVGLIDQFGELVLTGSSAFAVETPVWKMARLALYSIVNQTDMPEGWSIEPPAKKEPEPRQSANRSNPWNRLGGSNS
jgi:hypothetical protein